MCFLRYLPSFSLKGTIATNNFSTKIFDCQVSSLFTYIIKYRQAFLLGVYEADAIIAAILNQPLAFTPSPLPPEFDLPLY